MLSINEDDFLLIQSRIWRNTTKIFLSFAAVVDIGKLYRADQYDKRYCTIGGCHKGICGRGT